MLEYKIDKITLCLMVCSYAVLGKTIQLEVVVLCLLVSLYLPYTAYEQAIQHK
jgi:hypothetical protein